MKKKSILILFIIILLTIFSTHIYATDMIIGGAEDFLDVGTENILDKTKIKKTSDTIYTIFLVVGTSIVVVMGAILGIKFMGSSVQEKAEVKESLMGYVTGAIVIFCAVTIWTIGIKILQNIF